MRNLFYIVHTLMLVAILSSCFSSGIPNSKAINKIAIEEARKSTMDPTEAITHLKKEIDEAKHAVKLDYYAPRHLSSAEEALKKASDLLVNKAEPTLILQETIKAHKFLNAGKNIKLSVQRHLKPVFDEKDWLDSIKANHYLPDDYNDTKEDIADLIDDIETGNIDTALKEQNSLLKDMIALEIGVMKVKHLNEARAVLKKTLRIDGHKLAPTTYTLAEKTLTSAEEFIEMNSRDLQGIANVGAESLAAAQHAFHITEAVTKLIKTDDDDYEKYILDFENLIHRISQAANCGNLKHLPLYEQSASIVKMLQTKKTAHTAKPDAETMTAESPADSEPEADIKQKAPQVESATIPETNNEDKEVIDDQPEHMDVQETVDEPDTQRNVEKTTNTEPIKAEQANGTTPTDIPEEKATDNLAPAESPSPINTMPEQDASTPEPPPAKDEAPMASQTPTSDNKETQTAQQTEEIRDNTATTEVAVSKTKESQSNPATKEMRSDQDTSVPDEPAQPSSASETQTINADEQTETSNPNE